MKKLFTLAIAFFAVSGIDAQTIAGGNMESFHTVLISGTTPSRYTQSFASWYGLDSFAIALSNQYLKPDTAANAYKAQIFSTNTAHVGTAAKIMTKIQDTLGVTAGCLSNCAPSINLPAVLSGTPFLNAVTFTGGTALTIAQKPTSITLWIEYAPNGADTAHIMVKVLDSSGTVIGTADSAITATLTSQFVSITPHITYTASNHPRTLQVMLMSSPLGAGRGKDSSILWADDVVYAIATGVNEVNASQAAVKFYPNPSTGVVYLYTNLNEKLSWQVFNANGQVVVNKELVAANREDLSYLPAGTYFYNVTNSQGQVVQKDKFTLVK